MAVLVAGGSMAFTTGYAVHLRSEGYRRDMEAELSAFFNLPCEVKSIRGETFSSRAFEHVAIHLPDRRDRLFTCRKAVWHEETLNGRPTNRLELSDGVLMLGSDRWQHGDYRTVFESGLGHDFAELQLSRVDLSDFEFGFRRGDLSLQCRRAGGVVDMAEGAEEGVARLQAYSLNGLTIPEGVTIGARFKVRNGVDVTDVTLELPTVPLASIGLESALKGSITSGEFSGTVRYLNTDPTNPPEVWVSGRLGDAELAELTRAAPFGPFTGRVSVNVEAARISERMVTHLRGGGSVADVSFANFAGLIGLKKLSGRASFSFDPVQIELGQIHRLRVEGLIQGVYLEEILSAFSEGSATGRLTIRVNNFDIDDNMIKSGDLEISVVPPEGQPGTIDRALLLDVARRFLNFSWPEALPESFLPERIEYAEFGTRLLIRDNQLRILGTHGADQDVVLTIKVFGQSFGVIRGQREPLDLTPWIEGLLERARQYDPRQVPELFKRKSGSPTE